MCVCGAGYRAEFGSQIKTIYQRFIVTHTHTHRQRRTSCVSAVCCLLRLIKNVPHVNGNFVNFYLFISSASANSPWPTAPVPSTLPTLCLFSPPACLSSILHFIDIAHFLSFSFSLSLAQSALCALPEMYQVPLLILIFLYISVCVYVCLLRHLAFNGPHN